MFMGYVLLAEDDPHIQLLIQRKLETAGYKVRTTPNGDEAVRLALDEMPLIVLLDVFLMGRDGLNVCRQIKEAFGSKSPPVLVVSANGKESDVAAGEAAGADDYLIKPFSPRDLLERVEALLRR